jgi:hypothetical protein
MFFLSVFIICRKHSIHQCAPRFVQMVIKAQLEARIDCAILLIATSALIVLSRKHFLG